MNFDFSWSRKWSVPARTGQKMERSFFRFSKNSRNGPITGAFKPFLGIAGLHFLDTLLIYQGVKGLLRQVNPFKTASGSKS